MKRRMILAMVILAATAGQALAQATMAKYRRLREDMTYSQVRSVLGQPSKTLTEVKSDAFSMAIYQWDGAKPDSGIHVGFVNGEISSIGQYNLD